MQKTKELEISCEEARLVPTRYGNKVKLILDAPEINEMFQLVEEEDLAAFIAWNGNKPEDIISLKDLEKWAEENGYIKE